ncbi:hypothetical protein EJD97_004635 [Solanum chilense]|uniref:Integrase core domain containing protein n=1 Tax=Solanum chilense TaxID=4083 RepID=A0A6N2BTU8_SOLCI|nr:hypothetical protein EJD97_004635 [Solanum chilense]
MRRSIAEAEERMEWKIAQHTERKIMEVHQRLDAFELHVLAQPTEDTILAALFSTAAVSPPQPREHAKRRKDRHEDEARAQKRELLELEAARRASITDEEARQLRAIELAAGPSSSRVVKAEKSTTDGVVIVERGTKDSVVDAEDTTEGVQTIKRVGSRTPKPPAC